MMPMGYQSQGRCHETHLLHLDLNDRRRIARWRHAGVSIDIIAEKLGRHRSTIFREVRRNVYARLPH